MTNTVNLLLTANTLQKAEDRIQLQHSKHSQFSNCPLRLNANDNKPH